MLKEDTVTDWLIICTWLHAGHQLHGARDCRSGVYLGKTNVAMAMADNLSRYGNSYKCNA